MNAPQWIEYTGSDEQIEEINNAEKYITRLDKNRRTQYLICEPHPYADMICQWARTGQPVWVKMKSNTYSNWDIYTMRGFDLIYQDHVVSVIKSTTPDWNIPGAEYRLTPFED